MTKGVFVTVGLNLCGCDEALCNRRLLFTGDSSGFGPYSSYARAHEGGRLPPVASQQPRLVPISTDSIARSPVQVRSRSSKAGASASALCVEIGAWRRAEREIRLSRAALFDRVWSEPVEQLAREWGFSGRGLAKACHRLQAPVPPCGHWAKAKQRRRMALGRVFSTCHPDRPKRS